MENKLDLGELSRRERQIMDIIYRLGEANAQEVMEEIEGAPRNATVRKLMAILEEKGYLKHKKVENKFIYAPTISAEKACSKALDNILTTFFKGSTSNAVIALMKRPDVDLSDNDMETIASLIDKSKDEGR